MDIETARTQMIEQQIRAWEVLDPAVLQVMSDVPRERFVPQAYRDVAFADSEIPLAHGQHMMAPCLEGRMLQALMVQPNDNVLEIGTGSGFVTACLCRLANSVTSYDYFDEFVGSAKSTLQGLGISNATVETVDATTLSVQKKFDVIAVTASTPVREQRFRDALTIGGRLFVVEGSDPAMDALLVRRLSDTEFAEETLFETSLTPMINSVAPKRFVL